MCLIALGWKTRPDCPLLVIANRDEFHRRATAPLAFWADAPDVLAGRDLESGGTWMGVTRSGRFAALTNYRDPSAQRSDARSRGLLVSGFLTSDACAADYGEAVRGEARHYNGFNLLLCDGNTLFWVGYQGRGDAQARDAGARHPCALQPSARNTLAEARARQKRIRERIGGAA
jgi:uncharacterized protein with NRDE domain